MLKINKYYVVCYDSNLRLLTKSKKVAEKFKKTEKRKFPLLDWKVLNLEEFGQFVYSLGVNEQYEEY